MRQRDKCSAEHAALERFSQLYSESIPAVPDVIPALRGREERECGRHEGVDVLEGARARGPHERFQFGKRHFDRIEVGAVGRQKPEVCAHRVERGLDVWLVMDREVIQDDNVAGVQHRY